MAIDHLIFPSGALGTNTALLWCTRTREGILIDPGGEPEEILDIVLQHGVSLRTIALTHAHPDNVGAVPLLREETSCGIALHKADAPLWENMADLCGELGMLVPDLPEIDEYLAEGHFLTFGKERIETIHLPGHSPGHCGFMVASLGFCLVGDTCFAHGTGRTDLWGGDESDLQRSLDRISRLPGDWTLVPGHGATFPPGGVGNARRLKGTNI